jgi:hypothetical protein
VGAKVGSEKLQDKDGYRLVGADTSARSGSNGLAVTVGGPKRHAEVNPLSDAQNSNNSQILSHDTLVYYAA